MPVDGPQVAKVELSAGDALPCPLRGKPAFHRLELIRVMNIEPVPEDLGTGI
jgi:hypothetical protein